MSDKELRNYCIEHFGADVDCTVCPCNKDCDNYIKRNGTTPLFDDE